MADGLPEVHPYAAADTLIGQSQGIFLRLDDCPAGGERIIVLLLSWTDGTMVVLTLTRLGCCQMSRSTQPKY